MNDSSPRRPRLVSRLLASISLGLGALVGSGIAEATPSEAQAIFDQGVADMLAGHFETACADIEKSYRLEPLPGVMFTLAECFAGAGKTASALSRYTDFRTLLTALPSERRLAFEERERLALSRSEALAQSVPDLSVAVSRPAAGQVVTINGERLDPPSFGVARRVDPGIYVVRSEAEGRTPWELSVTIEARQHRRIVVPTPSPARAVAAPAVPPKSETSSRPAWLYVSGAVGIAGVVVGLSSGAVALSRKRDVDLHCPSNRCDSTGLDAVDAGRSAATVSNLGFGLGAVGLVGAAAGWFLSSPGSSPSARSSWRVPRIVVAPTGGHVCFAGDFQ